MRMYGAVASEIGVVSLNLQGGAQAVKEAVSYSRALASLANDPTLPPGLGPVSVFGGRLQTEGRDLRDLFRCASARTPALCVAHSDRAAVPKQESIPIAHMAAVRSRPAPMLDVHAHVHSFMESIQVISLAIRCAELCIQTHSPDILWSCRIYVEESLRINDAFTEQLEDDVADMQTIMGLGAREAADIRSEIVSKSYKYAACTQAQRFSSLWTCSVEDATQALAPAWASESSSGSAVMQAPLARAVQEWALGCGHLQGAGSGGAVRQAEL